MYNDCARRAPPPPFGPSEPSEPSRRRRVQWHSRIGGGERSEPITRMRIMPYDTESQSRNVLASPLGDEGHEVAKRCTRVRMIMILDVDVTAERRHYNTHRPRGRYHNPRPERPSNLRTFRPNRPVNLKNLFSEPFEPGAALRSCGHCSHFQGFFRMA